MSLIICPECQKQISSHASTCPHCGYPVQEHRCSDLAADAPLQEPQQKKSKKKLVILLSILVCLILGAAGCFGYMLFAPEAECPEDTSNTENITESVTESTAETVIKDEDYLYQWLTENGTLLDGTILHYTVQGPGNTLFTLAYDTRNYGDDFKWYIESYTPVINCMRTKVHVTLFWDSQDNPVWDSTESPAWIRVTGAEYLEGYGYELAYCHSPQTFTSNSPVKHGNFKEYLASDIDPLSAKGIAYSKMRSTCYSESQATLCQLLDWLKDSFCPVADMTMADFGYPMYK